MSETTGTFSVNWESLIFQEIANRHATRKMIAQTYCYLLDSSDADWPKINAAIMERWSPSGLIYIKELAWKRRREGRDTITEQPRRAGEPELFNDETQPYQGT